ncbi:hypothetical protein [uncultured Ilyobacter sp.]|uniref:hypothetical protein n=1 Tax=uncultured Ilyobacter sp. TaxID=544433 RepID=UPI002AA71D24|nr:hypothetical protein [uncultured Ilyobacter sp.]
MNIKNKNLGAIYILVQKTSYKKEKPIGLPLSIFSKVYNKSHEKNHLNEELPLFNVKSLSADITLRPRLKYRKKSP